MTLRFIKEIPSDMFIELDEIGAGSFSTIFSAIHVNTNTKVALKVSLIQNKEEINLMSQEIMINKTLNHPFICRFFSEFDTEHLKILSMELIDGVSLQDYLNKKGRLTIAEAQNIFSQLLITIEYLHDEAHIAHHDLKLENIMIDSHDNIRLIDFGFTSQNSKPKSIPYCAPEVLLGQNYTKQADIWSMGIILFYLIHGDLPYYDKDTNTLINLILNTNIVFPQNFDADLIDLLSKMLNKDPTKRIKIDEIKMHPFIKNVKILNIDYKRLFSLKHNSNEIPCLKCYKHDSNIKINTNSVSPIFRRNHSKSLYTPTNYALKNNLHEIVNLKTDDINLLIESRKNYSNKLNALIQSAFDPNSKYYLSQFKTRKRRVSMARSCSHMINNAQHLQQSPKQFISNHSDVELPLQQYRSSSYSKPRKGRSEESPLEHLLNSSDSLKKDVNDSPLEQLLNSSDSLHLKIQNEVNNSPLEQLLNSSDSLPLKIQNEVNNSPLEQLLNSSDSLPSISFQGQHESNNKNDDESPMKKFLRSTDSLPPKTFQKNCRFGLDGSPINKLLLSTSTLSVRSNQIPLSDSQPGSAISIGPSSSFRRIQAPMMALNRKPSNQKFKLSDI